MIYKGILLDIDNTLYDYKKTHSLALEKVMEFCASEFDIPKDKLQESYGIARKKVHIELSETASSHNRLLYFQKMLEILDLNSLEYSMKLYNIYWDNFLEAMEPFDGVYEFLEKYKNKICLVTDLTAHIQFRKIEKLKLDKYCKYVVTSEEAGKEKPHPYMYMIALHKLDLKADEVCMIGDSFKKDIFGAINLNIDAIWFNHEDKEQSTSSNLITEIKTFKDIMELV